MEGTIYLIDKDGELRAMTQQPYKKEDTLQGFLEKYNNLLAGEQMNESDPRRWLFISREMGIPKEEGGSDTWSLDHLFLDQDGIPTLVEVKRSSDSRSRREVVAQMLDYAANAVVHWPIEKIRTRFETICQEQGIEPVDQIRECLGVEDIEDFWEKAKTNLRAEKIRLVFVADKIPQELRLIVEFLNRQMDPAEVLAVEIKHYSGPGWKSLIPRVIGQTEEAREKKNPHTERQWDEKSFFQELGSRRSSEDAEVARKILEWAKNNLPRFWWGKGKQDGSFIPILDHNNISYYPIAVWTYGKVEIQFQWLKTRPPFDSESKRKELLDRLNRIPGVQIPVDAITLRPNIFLSVFKEEDALKRFLEILEWVVQEIKAS